MSLPIGVQVYSIRDEAEADIVDTFRKVKEMGYDGVELAGLYGHSPEYVKGVCDALGLVPISAHVPILDMLNEPDKTFETYRTLGCKYIVVPYVTEERRPGGDHFFAMIDEINELGKKAREYGLILLYHNHDFEFRKVDGEYGIDILYSRIPKENLQTELDTCWVNVGGEDPADFILKYSGRAPVVHLKDFHMSGKLPQHLYALIGMDDEKKDDEPSTFEFRPCGHGMQDMPAIIDASVKAGAEWVIVEQDEPSMGLSRLDSVKASIEYLKSFEW